MAEIEACPACGKRAISILMDDGKDLPEGDVCENDPHFFHPEQEVDVLEEEPPDWKAMLDEVRALREPLQALRDGTDPEVRSILRELRGELARIRTRLDSLADIEQQLRYLDSLAGMEQQLRYQGGRMMAIEQRFATLVETKLDPSRSAPTPPATPP